MATVVPLTVEQKRAACLEMAAREDVEVIVPDDISELDGGQGL